MFLFANPCRVYIYSKTIHFPTPGMLQRRPTWVGPVGCMQPRIAMNVAQHKIVNLLKTFFSSLVFVSVCVFNMWPKTALLLPVWPRNAKSLDTPATFMEWSIVNV